MYYLNVEKCTFRYRDEVIELTKNEMKILSLLIKSKGKVVSRDKLMLSLWNENLNICEKEECLI